MTQRLAGKTALITGAAQGLGAGIALALAREGARVVATDINEAGAAATAERIDRELGSGTAFALRQDTTSEAHWQAAVAFAKDKLGGLSVLVNNAGIAVLGTVEELDYADWRRTMAVNADGPFLGCKHALPLLRQSQPASIVNMSSVAGMIAAHNLTAYNASKAAVWMLTKSVALHCAKEGWNVRCNSVHPTFVRTPILDAVIGSHENEAMTAKLARQVPIGRIGEVADVAAAVVYLASDESAMMTGSELKLDGGMTAM